MQSINNYNSPDNSTNYFIGSVGEGGNVTNIYNVNLYDETTKIFTEPVTGAQYQTTGWVYDYNTRTYQLSLASGTFLIGDADIDRIDLTYGDDELTISYYSGGSLVTTDTYAYVIATEHQHAYTSEITTEATCTTPGMVTYTCTTCGHQYTEELPLKEHTYTTEITTEPTCTDPGEQTYTCSVCGNQYTEPIEVLGHDWQPSEVTQTTYNLPPGTSCPACDSTNFTSVLSKGTETFGCTCNDCGKEWVVSAEVTYGQTTYTCTRCGETKVEKEDEDSGLFEAIGNFIANGIGWVTDKLSDLINSISGINDIFSGFITIIKEKAGDFPSFLGAAISCLPEDFTTVIWFAVIAAVALIVWKKFFS